MFCCCCCLGEANVTIEDIRRVADANEEAYIRNQRRSNLTERCSNRTGRCSCDSNQGRGTRSGESGSNRRGRDSSGSNQADQAGRRNGDRGGSGNNVNLTAVRQNDGRVNLKKKTAGGDPSSRVKVNIILNVIEIESMDKLQSKKYAKNV